MKGLTSVLGVLAVAGVALILAPGVASAKSTTVCTGALFPGTYHKLVVPADATCISRGLVTIHGGVTVEPGATLVIGSEGHPELPSKITGGVTATNAMNVQIHFATINGGVDVHGGAGPFGGPFGVTWDTIEDSVIHGGATIEGYDGFWSGFIRNTVYGNVNLNDNVVADPDGNEFVTNVIHGNLNCFGNEPPPQVGDSGGSPNVVTGHKTGQCVAV